MAWMGGVSFGDSTHFANLKFFNNAVEGLNLHIYGCDIWSGPASTGTTPAPIFFQIAQTALPQGTLVGTGQGVCLNLGSQYGALYAGNPVTAPPITNLPAYLMNDVSGFHQFNDWPMWVVPPNYMLTFTTANVNWVISATFWFLQVDD